LGLIYTTAKGTDNFALASAVLAGFALRFKYFCRLLDLREHRRDEQAQGEKQNWQA
jgi:hypothetical protein